MIRNISHATVFVLDQDQAKEFYTAKLGLEVREDAQMGDFRWLTVGAKGQPDFELVLMAIKPGPTLDEESCAALRLLVKKGALGGGVFETPDCEKAYAELKARGVEFLREPKKMPYGTEALLRDDSGNFFSLTERH